ncbi:MAG: acyltransferase family protein, partial [Muribaculaceae bacterium]|nr:acyltransferase family protein [Muribaculaceae bacterium]
MATKRIEWIDYARALSIWLIVFGHSSINSDVVNQYLNSFHVAVFFMISGLFEKNLEESNLKTRITKGIKTLLLPYFFFNIIGLFSCWISPYIHPELYYGVSGINIWRNAIIGIFLFDDVVTPHSFLPIGPTWFLASLFLCKVLFCLFLKVIDLKTIIRIVLIIGFLTDLFALYYADFGMFSLDT